MYQKWEGQYALTNSNYIPLFILQINDSNLKFNTVIITEGTISALSQCTELFTMKLNWLDILQHTIHVI